MWDLLSYLISLIFVWNLQRSILRRGDKEPSSGIVLLLIILLFVPVLNVIITLLVWALTPLLNSDVKLTKFYRLERFFARKRRTDSNE